MRRHSQCRSIIVCRLSRLLSKSRTLPPLRKEGNGGLLCACHYCALSIQKGFHVFGSSSWSLGTRKVKLAAERSVVQFTLLHGMVRRIALARPFQQYPVMCLREKNLKKTQRGADDTHR